MTEWKPEKFTAYKTASRKPIRQEAEVTYNGRKYKLDDRYKNLYKTVRR